MDFHHLVLVVEGDVRIDPVIAIRRALFSVSRLDVSCSKPSKLTKRKSRSVTRPVSRFGVEQPRPDTCAPVAESLAQVLFARNGMWIGDDSMLCAFYCCNLRHLGLNITTRNPRSITPMPPLSATGTAIAARPRGTRGSDDADTNNYGMGATQILTGDELQFAERDGSICCSTSQASATRSSIRVHDRSERMTAQTTPTYPHRIRIRLHSLEPRLLSPHRLANRHQICQAEPTR